ncbi:MAG: 2-dehydropantoate 2-reductase [Chloroflexi bacterium]|nr:2-dehydropantoate 2-reductase [Chloroflexota bacterium]
MARNMAVLGAGAIGASIGADLTQAGHDVLLIDQWPAHVEAMKANGVHVTMREEEFVVPVQALHLCEMKDLHRAPLRQFDIVFLAAKSYDTSWMVEFIKPYLKPDGVLVSVQNSLNDEWISPVISRQRDIGCAFELSAQVFEPGRVVRNTTRATTNFVLGELDGNITPRLQEVAEVLRAVGNTKVTDNIWGAKWTKLMFNTMVSSTRGALNATQHDLLEDPGVFDLVARLGGETARVGTTLGYSLEPILGLRVQDFLGPKEELFKAFMRSIFSYTGKASTSMIQHDIAKGRLTETEYINGLAVKKGREAGVPTPANEAMTAVMKQIDEGVLQPGMSNLQILKQYMSGRKAIAT